MACSAPRFWEIFFEVYQALPRQGPGSWTSTARALRLCSGLPSEPEILDLGCGTGAQTLDLGALTPGLITAVDNHLPSIVRLNALIVAHGLQDRIKTLVADMQHLDLQPEGFDLIWSEGALYQIGIENALHICSNLLRTCGCLAFTDAVWRKQDPPPEVRESFELDYPDMAWTENVLAMIRKSGFELLGHFTLPDQAWWQHFYSPMQRRIQELRSRHVADWQALEILEQLAKEPEMHRKYSRYYAYEFFVLRLP